jgi:hypothetical protein
MRKNSCALALCLLAALTLPCIAKTTTKPKKRLPREIHRELRPTYLHSLIPASKRSGSRSLQPVTGQKLGQMSVHQEKKTGVMGKLGIETVGGPPDLGTTRPNEWSGLQTTIPAGVPGRTQGITVTHF